VHNTGTLTVPTPTSVAGQGPKGTRGAGLQQTPFPLGIPPGSSASVTQIAEVGQEPWSPSTEDLASGPPAAQSSVAVQAVEAMNTSRATSPAGQVIVSRQEVGSMAQAIRAVFTSTLGQGLEVTKVGKAAASIPDGMDTDS
jgi:hypothetical protein